MSSQVDRNGAPLLGYRPALDGLRALAVGLVMAFHASTSAFSGGVIGVTIFFVLSGYLITKLLVEELDRTDTINLRAFYGRRLYRLAPALIALLIVVTLLSWHLVHPGLRGKLMVEVVLAFLYLTNLQIAFFGLPTGQLWLTHTWSLAVEEHFYLFWPWTMRRLRLGNRDGRAVVRGLLLAAGAIGLVRIVVDLAGIPDMFMLSPLRFDGFAVGGALAFAHHRSVPSKVLDWMKTDAAAGMALVWIVAFTLAARRLPHLTGANWNLVNTAPSAVLIVHLLFRDRSLLTSLSRSRPAVWMGKRSYSIYLWHPLAYIYFSKRRFPSIPLPMLGVIKVVAGCALAAASYRFVEMRFLARRNRLRELRTADAAAPSVPN